MINECSGSGSYEVWLRRESQVDCDLSVCQGWRIKHGSGSSKIRNIVQLEAQAGDKLRLPQYEEFFEGMVGELALQLREDNPPVDVSSILLSQWYAKYHPASVPLRVESAMALEAHLGDEMRRLYSDMGRH